MCSSSSSFLASSCSRAGGQALAVVSSSRVRAQAPPSRQAPTVPHRGTAPGAARQACKEEVGRRATHTKGKDSTRDGAEATRSCNLCLRTLPPTAVIEFSGSSVLESKPGSQHRLVGLFEKSVLKPLKKPSHTGP